MDRIDESLLTCLLCGKKCSHLGSHLWHSHKMKAREYKETFGLNYNQPLISREIYEKKSRHWHEHKEEYMANAMKNLTGHQFKKGDNHPPQRVSEQKKDKLIEQNEELKHKEWKACPVCKVKYKNLDSHLYMKHGLLTVKNKDVKNN